MAFDQKNLYLLAECYNYLPGHYIVESLRRDFTFGKNDNFLVFIDPFNNLTDGFSFGSNAAGAQWDGLMHDGGQVDLSWDNRWTSAVRNYKDRWVFEAAIPFKTLRYKKGVRTWGINFSRMDLKSHEKSSWAPVPRQFPTASLAYTGTLLWESPPPDPGLNVSLIPYAMGDSHANFEAPSNHASSIKAGMDAKIALSSSLNLDLTLHPDFSQVEVDQQVTNLDRYELFFPEKRQFFLENGDLFANFGYDDLRPFFSRRIGLDAPISYGARLSGNLNKNWRMGAMDMRTTVVDTNATPARNYRVLAIQRRVFSRSSIRFLYVDMEAALPFQDSTKGVFDRYNRNAGLEYDLASADNLWTGKALVLKSWTSGQQGQDLAQAADLKYQSKSWMFDWHHEIVGQDYRADVGYIPRNGYVQFNPEASKTFFPKAGPILSHGPDLKVIYMTDLSLHPTDQTFQGSYLFSFRNQSTWNLYGIHSYVRLLRPFDPTNSGKDSLSSGTAYSWNRVGFEYDSKPQSLGTYILAASAGGYYDNGRLYSLSGQFGYRFQPVANVSVLATLNALQLPHPWGNTQFWLLGPKVDLTFSNTVFFTTYLQYNQQINNININARFQWRYQPASDVFLVYTDNYFPAPFMVRNRAIVLKVTYWLNK